MNIISDNEIVNNSLMVELKEIGTNLIDVENITIIAKRQRL